MTIRETLKKRLCDNGLSDQQAQEVMDREIEEDAEGQKLMAHRWNDRMEDYPAAMLNVLWFSVRRRTLQYIDEKCPKAWFRPMFETQQTQETQRG